MSKLHDNITSIFDKYASVYEEKYMDVTKYKGGLDYFMELLGDGACNILEIGCGPGNISKYLLSLNENVHLLGIDVSEAMILLSRKNNPSAEFKIMSAVDITSLNTSFKGIVCGFCLPYLSKQECLQLFENAAKMLDPNGLFYLSLNVGPYELSGFQRSSNQEDQLYMYFYEQEFIVKSLESIGFYILHNELLDYRSDKSRYNQELVLVARII